MGSWKVSTRLVLLTGVLLLLLAAVGTLGLWGAQAAQQGLRTVYEERTVPMEDIGAIERLETGVQIALLHALTEGSDPAALQRDTDAAWAEVDRLWAHYAAALLTPEERARAGEAAQRRDGLRRDAVAPMLAALQAGDTAAARRLYQDRVHPAFDAAEKGMEGLLSLQVREAEAEYRMAAQRFARLSMAAAALLLVALVFGAGFGLAMVRSLGRQLGAEPAQAMALATAVAGGDLSCRIVLRPGDTGSVMAALQRMQEQLQATVATVRGNAESVAAAAAQIAHGNRELSQRTEEQASALQQTSAAMAQMTDTVRSNAQHARDAADRTREAAAVVRTGGEAFRAVVGTMQEIRGSADRIADIVGVIDGISFQTNLLALNAAVEAARAGDQGRGFAVVAGEVRVLAQRAAQSAREIKALIGLSTGHVAAGADQVAHASAAMARIDAAIRDVDALVAGIGDASDAQSSGVAQVGQAVAQIDLVTQHNAALVEEASAASDSLQAQARQLVETVAVFRLPAAARAAG